ncbi:hypothetical protein JCM8097_006394 [Rhodosporidiobolus ruineniae]
MAGGGGGLSSHLTSVLCWSFLPGLFTNLALSTFYRLSPSSRPVLPPHASPPQIAAANRRAQSHHRRARIALLAAYLLYSILSVYWAQSRGPSANYYALLGLPRDIVEADGGAAVKKHWKRLARVYHPDKVGKQGEALFVELKKGVDVLQDENKRWAYERFGPSVTSWGGGKLVTNREYLNQGALHSLIFWGSAALSIFAFTFFRKSERRYNFWRYLALCLSFALELHFLLRPFPSPTFSLVFPNRLTYEHISLHRQLFISTSMAMSQIAPLLFPAATASPGEGGTEEDAMARALADAEQLKPLLQRLAQLTATAEAEAAALQQLELRPLLSPPAPSVSGAPSAPNKADERRLRAEVQAQMVRTFEDLQVKSNPATAGVWREAIERGRARKGRKEKGGKGADGEGKKRRRKKKAVGGEGAANGSGGSTPSTDSPITTSSSTPADNLNAPPPTLDAAAIPPAVTLLASPPASPRLGFPTAAIPLPSPGTVEEVKKEELPAEKKQEAKEEEKDAAKDSRLPTPPPE